MDGVRVPSTASGAAVVVERATSRRLPFRVAFVVGVTPDKWLRTWAERLPREPLESFPVQEWEQVSVLEDGRADMAFVRLPVERALLHVIPLYHEVQVVVLPQGPCAGNVRRGAGRGPR